MKIRQIRNATLRITFGGVEFLVDPWLVSKAEGFTFGQGPFASEVVDPAQLDKAVPLFVQNDTEVAVMKRSGFKDVQTFTDNGVALLVAS